MKAFEEPTPQIIMIEGQSPFVNVTCPTLQRYFINQSTQNSEYATIQLSTFDMPAYDDLRETIGSESINLALDIIVYRQSHQATSTYPDEINQEAFTSFQKGTDSLPVVSYVALPPVTLQISISTATCNISELAIRVRDAILQQSFLSASSQRQAKVINEWGDQSYWLKRVFNAHFTDFYYDEPTKKLAMRLTPVDFNSQFRYTDVQVNNVLMYTINTVGAFEVTLRLASPSNQPAARLLATLFGGVLDAAGTQFYSKFVFEPARPAYDPPYFFAPTLYNSNLLALSVDGNAGEPELFRYLTARGALSYTAFAPNPSKLAFSDYVYIKGTPEISFFTSDGRSTDTIAVLPRNREYGSVPHLQSMLPRTYGVKTTMNSIRSMNFVLSDQFGAPINFPVPYQFTLVVTFDS